MSQPPTNSLSMYSWGMVGQSEYSLMPIAKVHISSGSLRSICAHLLRQSITSRTCSQLLVLQDVERGEFVRVDALQAQDLDARP